MIDWDQAITAEARAKERETAAREEIRLRRDQAIDAGIIVSGVPLHTDERSRSNVMGAAMSAMLDPDYSVAWKGADGVFVTLTAPQVIAVAQSIRAHVQACFDREAELLADHEAGRPYAVNEGWPVQDVRLANGAAVTQRVGAGVYRVQTARADWAADTPEGLTVTLSHDGTALTVWVWRGSVLADLSPGEHVLLRPTDEA